MLPIAILAGGLGTRLLPVTQTIPKAMVDVCGTPFVDYQLGVLRDNGFTRVVFCVSHLGEMIVDHVGDGSAWGLDVAYSFDGPQRLGTAGAIKTALPLLGDDFFTIYGDSYLLCDYADVERAYIAAGVESLMTVYRNDGALVPSNVEFADGTLRAYEKQRPTPAMHHIDFGISVFARSAFDAVPADRPTDLADVVHDLLAKKQLAGYEVPMRFYEVGTPEGIADLEAFLARR
jgi:NDP-sugar pyrophosphorylase family protein